METSFLTIGIASLVPLQHYRLSNSSICAVNGRRVRHILNDFTINKFDKT